MKIKITAPIVNSEKAFNKSLDLSNFNDNILSKFLNTNSYINNFEIGILMVYTEDENFENYGSWYKLKKIKYDEENKFLYYEFFLKNDELTHFINSSDEESNKILAKKILESLENLDKLPKKVKDFDKERFKQDIKHFFKEHDLL